MKYYKSFFALITGALFTLISCDDDETLDLLTYPENKPFVSISDVTHDAEPIVKATYNSEGILELDNKVSRTHLFRFKASPEDINLSYEILSKNIPDGLIEISTTKDVLKPGYTDSYVTVTLKDEDFGFAQTNYGEETYEIGVKTYFSGYKIDADPIESKIVIQKEAYTLKSLIKGKDGSTTAFERAYSKGVIVNSDPISYSFTVQLDKPALKATKIKFATTGIDDKFLNTVTVTPAEVTIPAGEKTSEAIVWTVKDDFLLQTDQEEFHTLTVTPVFEDSSVVPDESNGVVALNISKVFRNFEYIETKDPGWTNLAKTGWAAELLTIAYGSISSIIDGIGGMIANDIYTYSNNMSFIIDMSSAKTFKAIEIDYYRNSNSASAPKNVKISTSMDKTDWTSQGEINTPQSYEHYMQFFTPATARYVKFELSEHYNGYIDITEIYVYE